MFDTRTSSNGRYEYVIQIERTPQLTAEGRYAVSIIEVIGRATGNRITNYPSLDRHYDETPEGAIEKALAEAESVRTPERRSRHATRTARLLYDSHQAASPVGLRTAGPGPRKFLYASDDYLIDVQVQPGRARDEIVLVGQVISSQQPEALVEGSGVLLERGSQPVAQTITNRFGEFDLESCGPVTELSLTFALERARVVVKLGSPAGVQP